MVPLNENQQTLPPISSSPMGDRAFQGNASTMPPLLARAKSTGSILSKSENGPGRCKYKTGKCNNDRSFKRNGQLHQLCVFHREKANRIQRKFDRQKRTTARLLSPSLDFKRKGGAMPAISLSARFALDQHQQQYGGSKSLSSIAPLQRSLSENHDYPRISTENNAGFLFDDLWATIPHLAPHIVNPESPLKEEEKKAAPDSRTPQQRMSLDEIDFLCSAILT